MDKKLAEAINEQLNFEMYSSYVYLAMASHLKSLNLNGFAHWMDLQVQEEIDHAKKFYSFLHDRGENVEFETIPKPQKEWDSPLAVFEAAYAHEQEVTSRISNLMDMALKLKDHATLAHLQWFITEQIEEEANSLAVVQQLRLVKDSIQGLMLLDRELAQRQLSAPTAE